MHYGGVAYERYRYRYKAQAREPEKQRDAAYYAGHHYLPGVEAEYGARPFAPEPIAMTFSF